MSSIGTDALSECIALIDQFECATEQSALPDLRQRIERLLPAAESACLEVGEPDATVPAFRELISGLAGADDNHPSRMRLLDRSHYQVAIRLKLRDGLRQLDASTESDHDPITAFVRFASDALNLAVDALHWFPDRSRPVDGMTCPKERRLLAEAISPREIRDFNQTMYARAAAEARRIGEAGFALPKLERIHKALQPLAGLVVEGSEIGLFGTDIGFELARAVTDALVLTAKTTTPDELADGLSRCADGLTADFEHVAIPLDVHTLAAPWAARAGAVVREAVATGLLPWTYFAFARRELDGLDKPRRTPGYIWWLAVVNRNALIVEGNPRASEMPGILFELDRPTFIELADAKGTPLRDRKGERAGMIATKNWPDVMRWAAERIARNTSATEVTQPARISASAPLVAVRGNSASAQSSLHRAGDCWQLCFVGEDGTVELPPAFPDRVGFQHIHCLLYAPGELAREFELSPLPDPLADDQALAQVKAELARLRSPREDASVEALANIEHEIAECERYIAGATRPGGRSVLFGSGGVVKRIRNAVNDALAYAEQFAPHWVRHMRAHIDYKARPPVYTLFGTFSWDVPG